MKGIKKLRKDLESPILIEYLDRIDKDSSKSEIRQRLLTFEEFVKKEYKTILDYNFIFNRLVSKKRELVDQNKIYVYDLFLKYCMYLKTKKLSRSRVQGLLNSCRRAINLSGDNLIDREFFDDYLKSSLPSPEIYNKSRIDDNDIVKLLYGCGNDLKLRTILTVLSSTGARIGEILKVKYKYIHWEWKDDIPPHIDLPAHITKTGVQRNAYLTTETLQALKDWIEYKYRDRKIVRKVNNEIVNESYVKPSDIAESYIFRMVNDNPSTPEEIEKMEEKMKKNYRYLYKKISIAFNKLVVKEGLGEKFKNGRNSISIHSLRWFVKDMIERYGKGTVNAYYWIGKKQKDYQFDENNKDEIVRLYHTMEPYLTFFDPKVVKQNKDQQKQIDKLSEQITQQKKEFLSYKFEQEINYYQEFLLGKYERMGGVNDVPVTDDIPKKFVNELFEDERKEDPNLTLEEMGFIKVKDIVNRIKPVSEEDQKLLNEYIEEVYGDNQVCLVFSFPSCISGMSDITPDQFRRNLNLLKPKLKVVE